MLTLVIFEVMFQPIYNLNGFLAHAIGLIPVLTAAFLLGLWGGVAMGLFLSGMDLFWLRSAPGMALTSSILSVSAFVIGHVTIGGFAGYLGDSNKRLKREIEARKRSERELIVNEKKYRTLFENSIEAIGMSRGNKIVSANKVLLDLLGYETLEELMKVPLLDRVAPESRDAVKEGMAKRARSEKVPSSFNHKLLRNNGDIVEVEMLSTELSIENERFVLSTFRDITARRKAEESMRQSEENFRALAENVNDAIFIFTVKGMPVYANERASELLGYTREELLASGLKALMGAGEVDEMHTRDKKRFEGKNAPHTYETILLRKDGKGVPVELTGAATVWQGKPAEIAIMRDITERKHREEKLNNYIKRLEILNKMKRDILELLPPEKISQNAVSYVRALVPCLTACIMTFNFKRREMIVWGMNASFSTGVKTGTRIPFACFKNIREDIDAFLRGEVVIIEDIKERSLLLPMFEYFYTQGTHAYVKIPLLCQSDLIGFLCLGFDRLDSFDHQYLDIAREVVDSVAIAVQNARLLETINEHRERLQALSVRLSEIDELDRQRLARELHDRVGQNLTALSINLNIIRSHLTPSSVRKTTSRFNNAQKLIEETMERIRDVMSDLRPEVLDEFGLLAALRWYGHRFSERTDVKVIVCCEDFAQRLPASKETALFRIAQEALTNVARHAGTDKAVVLLKQVAYKLLLTISDDGMGFDPGNANQQGGRNPWGLIIMQERAEAVGAHLRIKSAPGSGTRVIVTVNVGSL